MRNLKLQFCKKYMTTVLNVKSILCYENEIYLASVDKLYKCDAFGLATELYDQPGIVGIEYLALDNELCIATNIGEVILFNPQTGASREGTFCAVGIQCMAWSPDQDVVVFITKEQHVVSMTCSYDPISEHQLSNLDNNNFINVGWGKKETQFHGSEGKLAAKQKNEFQIPPEINELPCNIEISWRADGAYFAVSFVSKDFGRMFKIFDREGNLNYISEPQNGLYPPIAWRPSGTWLALPQRLTNKSTIALFEKNGLRHRELILPFQLDDQPIINIKWSTDSSILTLETRCKENKSSLWLYTINNYHWYLKQLLCFNENDIIATFRWDTRIGEEKTLHVLLQSGCYIIYRWHFFVDKLDNSGAVAVIDGKNVLLTDFSKAVIPPPMCSAKLIINDYINTCCLMINKTDELQLAIVDAKNNLHIFKSHKDSSLNLILDKKYINWCKDLALQPLEFGNMGWFSEECLLTIINREKASELILIRINRVSGECSIQSKLTVQDRICAFNCSKIDHLFIQTTDGRIETLSLGSDFSLQSLSQYITLDHIVDELLWFHNRVGVCELITLQNNGCLHIGTKQIAMSVTSICVVGSYLMYTNLSNVFIVRLSDQYTVAERRIEHGAKLVTASASDGRTVLQMPRGNLETFYPRLLSLELVSALLDNQHYSAAIEMLRKQRINLNIICDHNLCTFIEQLDTFLNDVQNVNWLNLFITDLQNKDFTCDMAASNYSESKRIYPKDFKTMEKKVDYICERLCEHMQGRKETRFQLPIITCYVKLGHLDKALELIWHLKHQECSLKKKESASEEALKYLLYLVDVNELYNIALGTYDLGLVLFVAEKSHKDPKEFLPFLNNLKKYKPNYRKFKIDEHLKRYEKALENISLCPSEEYFEEALAFIQSHKIYHKALKVYAPQLDYYRRICLAYADYLRANGKLENASIMYERGGNLSQALQSAKHIIDWRRVLVLSHRDNTNTDQINSIALSLVPLLQDRGQFDDAYELQKKYGHNYDEALLCLLKGKLFLKAMFEARLTMNHLIDNLVLPELLKYRIELETSLVEEKKLFLNYKQRLLSIREQHVQHANSEQHGPEDELDLLSDTTSIRSSSRYTINSGSTKTSHSSKNRRKHERKLLSLKPGNPFEDIALLDALHTLILRISNEQQHIHDICKALLELQLDDEAFSLQYHFKEIMHLLQNSLDEIWIPEIMMIQPVSNIGYLQLRNEQRYALIEPQKRFKPKLNIIEWQHEILK